jgi:signal transduction histidine kinase
MRKNIRSVISSTRMFGSLTRSSSEILRVDEVIHEAIQLMADTCSRERVVILFNPPEHLLLTRVQATSLEHVLLNLLLNAVQQIVGLRGKAGGTVAVILEPPAGKGAGRLFRILVKDDGPGIHRGLWGKIFEPGFTTRQEGSGMGLYISRNLAVAMGGELSVVESCILGGSTFAVELPCEF